MGRGPGKQVLPVIGVSWSFSWLEALAGGEEAAVNRPASESLQARRMQVINGKSEFGSGGKPQS